MDNVAQSNSTVTETKKLEPQSWQLYSEKQLHEKVDEFLDQGYDNINIKRVHHEHHVYEITATA